VLVINAARDALALQVGGLFRVGAVLARPRRASRSLDTTLVRVVVVASLGARKSIRVHSLDIREGAIHGIAMFHTSILHGTRVCSNKIRRGTFLRLIWIAAGVMVDVVSIAHRRRATQSRIALRLAAMLARHGGAEGLLLTAGVPIAGGGARIPTAHDITRVRF
jgi:hypothetical protein